MTPAEHMRQAEHWLAEAKAQHPHGDATATADTDCVIRANLAVQIAQVHATLATVPYVVHESIR